jgi:thiol-disulfide isomerase/thioredoxin
MKLTDLAPRPFALAAALALVAGAVLALEQPWAPHSGVPDAAPGTPLLELMYPAAPDFRGATGWVQSPPLDLVALRGQVVLVDFWTYSCVNCIRTFPHIEAWYERYNASGFTVVGVHTPEFRFEHDAANVQAAAERYHLTYPIAQDNDYRIWSAYNNRYWPAHYLIDAYGRVRHTHFGEGAYPETEDALRDLLRQAGRDPGPGRVETPGDDPRASGLSPELYAGATQGRDRVGLVGYRPGETVTHARPAEVLRDRIYLVGTWSHGDQSVTSNGNGSVLVRFRAGGANFVGDGPAACAPVLLDGAPIPAERAARDVWQGCIPLDAPRSYDFYAGPVEEHLVELRVPEGFQLFSFAFSPDGRR